MRYATPEAFRAALEDRLKNASLLLRRTAAGRVPCNVFTDPWRNSRFRRVLRAEIEASGVAELVMLESIRDGERDQSWRELSEPHKPFSSPHQVIFGSGSRSCVRAP